MTRAQDLVRVRSTGRRTRGRALELRIGEAATGASRVGIVVPRHGRTAVARNTVKRRLREIVRLERIGLRTPAAADIIVFALPPAYALSLAELRAELVELCTRAGH